MWDPNINHPVPGTCEDLLWHPEEEAMEGMIMRDGGFSPFIFTLIHKEVSLPEFGKL